jgi:hypothetical protein
MPAGSAPILVTVALTVLLSACAGRASNAISPTNLADLTLCAPLTADTTGWHEGGVPDLGLRFRYPASYQRRRYDTRHIPGSEDAWYRDGNPVYALSVRMIPMPQADREVREWAKYPEHGECVAPARSGGEPAARVVFHVGGNVMNNYNKEYPPFTVVAEWRFPGGRVVRLTGSGPDSASQHEHLAVIQTARFTHAPWQGGARSCTGPYVNQQAVHPAYRLRGERGNGRPVCAHDSMGEFDTHARLARGVRVSA